MLVASAIAGAHVEQTGSAAPRRMTAPSAAMSSTDPRTAAAHLLNRMLACQRALEVDTGFADRAQEHVAHWVARLYVMKAEFVRDIGDIGERSPEEVMAQIAVYRRGLEEAEAALLEHRSLKTLASARWIKHRVPIGKVLPPVVPNPNDNIKETSAAAPLKAGEGSEALVPGRERNLSTVYSSDMRSVARKSVLRMCVRLHAHCPINRAHGY